MSSFREMAESVADQGRNGDMHLLHITDEELQRLLETGHVTKNPKTGVYEASWFTGLRDAIESIGSVVGNYYLPGSELVTAPMTSKGSQANLGSTLGEVASLGSGVAGGVAGNMSNYGTLLDTATNAVSGTPTGTGTPGPWSGPVDQYGQPITDTGTPVLSTGGSNPVTDAITGASVSNVLGGLGTPGTGAVLPTVDATGAGFGSDVGAGVGGTGAGTSDLGTPAMSAAPGGSGLTDFLKSNNKLLLPGAAMAASVLAKPKLPDLSNLQTLAAQVAGGGANNPAGALASSLIPTVETGNLPPGSQALVQNALKDAQTAIRSKYASMGMSGSTAEQQELSSAESNAAAQSFQMAQQLTNTGLTAAGVSTTQDTTAASIYNNIMNAQLQQDQALQNALASFASASALGSGLSALAGK